MHSINTCTRQRGRHGESSSKVRGAAKNDDDSLSPVPLVSPSVASYIDSEKVLHSIFSPPHNQNDIGVQSTIFDQKNNVAQSCRIQTNFFIDRQPQIVTDGKSLYIRPPRCATPKAEEDQFNSRSNKKVERPLIESKTVKNSIKATPSPNSAVQSPSFVKYSHAADKNFQNNDRSPFHFTFSPSLSTLSEPFSSVYDPVGTIACSLESPESNMYDGIDGNGNIPSVHSRKSRSSTKKIPIQMLSIPSIQSCNSLTELNKIIHVLERQNNYPSLLRFAKRRLTEASTLNQNDKNFELKTNVENNHAINSQILGLRLKRMDSPGTLFHKEEVGTAHNTHLHDLSLNESSLLMSLSTEDDFNEDAFSEYISPRKPNKTQSVKCSLAPAYMENFNCNEGPVVQELYNKIQRLTQTIAEMESVRSVEQAQCNDKTHRLETLTQRSIPSNNQLDELRKMNTNLHQKVLEERANRNQIQIEAKAIHQQLRMEIEQLHEELERVSSETKSNSENWEKKKAEINSLLRSAQKKLGDTKKERDEMIQCLMYMMGDEKPNVKNVHMLSLQERANIIENSKAAFDQNKKELSTLKKFSLDAQALVCEHEKARDEAEHKLATVLEDVKHDKEDKVELQSIIKKLQKREVRNRQYYDQHIESVRQESLKQLREKEHQFQTIIASMNEEVSMFPCNDSLTYISGEQSHTISPIVKEQRKRSALADLKDKNSNLSQKLQLQGIKPVLKSKTEPISSSLKFNQPSIESLNINPKQRFAPALESKENDTKYSTLSDESAHLASVSTSLKNVEISDHRRLLIRAAGGRKGLTSKLKTIRSPRS